MEVYGQYNGKLGLICLAIYLIVLYKGRRTFSGKTSPSNNYWFVFIGMSLYSVLGFLEPDTYHYYRIYEEMMVTGSIVYVEPLFYWLAMLLPHSYFLWRLSIWGISALLMICSAKLLDLNETVLCFIAPLLFLTQLSVTRGAIGFSLMVFCSILLVQSIEKRQVLWALLAFSGILASNFMHKSLIVFLAILIVSFFVPLNKRTFIVSIFLFPFLYAVALRFFHEFSFFDKLSEEQSQLITNYQLSDKMEINFNGIMMTVFEKAILIGLVINITKKYLYDRIKTSTAQRFIYKYAYILIYISFLFLGQEVSNWISNRTLHAASFALVLCAAQCFDTEKVGKGRTLIEKILFVGLFVLTMWKQLSFIIKYWE